MGFKVNDRVLVEGIVRANDLDGNVVVVTEQRGTLSGHSQCTASSERVRPWTEGPPKPAAEFWKEFGEPYRIMSDGSAQQGDGYDPDSDRGIKWVPAENPQEVLCRYIRSLLKK